MHDRKPWPMWPFVLAVLIFIPVYTYINLEYRKEGRAYEPFQVMMDRMNAIVEKNIYDWYGLKSSRSDNHSEIAAKVSITSQSGDDLIDDTIPEQLKYYMPTRPILLPGISKVESPPTLTPGENLRIRCTVPAGLENDERLHLLAFYKEGDLYLLLTLFVEDLEEIQGTLQGEPTFISFEIPTDPINTETVNVNFLTEDRLSQWEMHNTAPFEHIEETEGN